MATKEEKSLLLKDLCARLPYGIKFKANNEEYIREIHYIKDEDVYIREYRNLPYWIGTIKPYLRPMSSMTEEEDKEWQYYKNAIAESCDERLKERISELHDWFAAHHFDFRGLIKKGLALEAPEGMYKTKEK